MTNRSRTRLQSGFTLIELIVTIAVMGILAAVGATMISDSFQTARVVDARQASASQARYAVERLAREIREVQYLDTTGGYNFTTATLSATKMEFVNGSGVTVHVSGNSADCGASNRVCLAYGASATPYPTLLSGQPVVFALRYLAADGSTVILPNNANAATLIGVVEVSLTVTDAVGGGPSYAFSRVAFRNRG